MFLAQVTLQYEPVLDSPDCFVCTDEEDGQWCNVCSDGVQRMKGRGWHYQGQVAAVVFKISPPRALPVGALKVFLGSAGGSGLLETARIKVGARNTIHTILAAAAAAASSPAARAAPVRRTRSWTNVSF